MPKPLDTCLDISNIKAVMFDFDGVFTDNFVYLTAQGEEVVRCSRYDGYGLQYLQNNNYLLAVVSSEKVPLATIRSRKLSLPCFQPISNKLEFVTSYLNDFRLGLDNLCYMGNDINDLDLLLACALPVIPPDSHVSLLACDFFVTQAKGGHGCVRELSDHFTLLLK